MLEDGLDVDVELAGVPAAPLLEAQEVDPVEVLVDAGAPLVAVGSLGGLAAGEAGAVAGACTAGAGLWQVGGLAGGAVESVDEGALVVAVVSVAVWGRAAG